MQKTYKEFTEAKTKTWKDIGKGKIARDALKHKKRMKAKQVLAYTTAHDEFTIFNNEKEYQDAIKYAKDMKWVRVE